MNLIRIDSKDLNPDNPNESQEFIVERLDKAGFDTDRPYEIYQGVNTTNFLFIQDGNQEKE